MNTVKVTLSNIKWETDGEEVFGLLDTLAYEFPEYDVYDDLDAEEQAIDMASDETGWLISSSDIKVEWFIVPEEWEHE